MKIGEIKTKQDFLTSATIFLKVLFLTVKELQKMLVHIHIFQVNPVLSKNI